MNKIRGGGKSTVTPQIVVFSGNKPPLGVVDKKLVEKNNPPMIY